MLGQIPRSNPTANNRTQISAWDYYTGVQEPHLRHNEVLIHVRQCALNHFDPWVRRGVTGYLIPFPQIPGRDTAGEVVHVGLE